MSEGGFHFALQCSAASAGSAASMDATPTRHQESEGSGGWQAVQLRLSQRMVLLLLLACLACLRSCLEAQELRPLALRC